MPPARYTPPRACKRHGRIARDARQPGYELIESSLSRCILP